LQDGQWSAGAWCGKFRDAIERNRVGVACIAASIALLAAVVMCVEKNGVWHKEGVERDISFSTPRMPERMSKGHAESSHPVWSPETEDSATSMPMVEQKKTRLKDAVDALVGGRFDESIEIYRLLASQNPGNPSYDLAAKILMRTSTRTER
jgi:hypothetical protein